MFQEIITNKLLPAVTFPDAYAAVRLAEALLEGGLDVMEVTFRTKATSNAIKAIVKELPEMHIGAGTILSADQLSAAQEAGAQFGLSPGINTKLVEKAESNDFPFIPGVATPSEIELALDLGFKTLKLFPASIMGGVEYLQSLEGPYHHTGVKFLTMGGINPANLQSYLGCEIVLAAGGSWLSPSELIQRGEFKRITEIVRESVTLAEQV